MAQVDCVPVNDELLAFLGELDNDWVFDTDPVKPIVNLKPSLKPRKPRKSRRVDLLNAHQELSRLQAQLLQLHGKLEFCESLDADRSSSGLDWKSFALQERILKTKADKENARLRRRVEAKARLICRVSALMKQQIEVMPSSVRRDECPNAVDLYNEAQVYHVLQACLDMRCRRDLDAIVQQFSGGCAVSMSELQKAQWRTFALSDNGVGMDFREAVLMPFSSAFIHRTISQHAAVNSLDVCKANVTHKPIPGHQCSCDALAKGPAQSDRRLILRRIVNVRRGMILLWEDASYWQKDETSMRALVRSSGWAFASPVPGHVDELSLLCSGGFIQIHATDGSPLKPGDVQVKPILRHMQALQQSRVACMEDALLLTHNAARSH